MSNQIRKELDDGGEDISEKTKYSNQFGKREKLLLLLFAYAAQTSNALAINCLAPCSPEMIKYFGYSEIEKGFYIGMLDGSFHFGRIFGGFMWGWACDKLGCRKSMLMSLFCIFLSLLVTSFSRTFFFAFLVRIFSGFSNGVLVMTKVLVKKVSTNKTHSRNMAWQSLVWAVSMLFVGIIGGYLSMPGYKYPKYFNTEEELDRINFTDIFHHDWKKVREEKSPDNFFLKYPFFFVTFIPSFFVLVVFIGTYFFLPSSCYKDDTPLLQLLRRETISTVHSSHQFQHSDDRKVKEEEELVKLETKEKGMTETKVKKGRRPFKNVMKALKLYPVRYVLVLCVMFVMSSKSYQLVFSSWSSAEISKDGLQLSSQGIGMAQMIIIAIPVALIVVAFYHRIELKLGVRNTLLICGMCQMVFVGTTALTTIIFWKEGCRMTMKVWTFLILMTFLERISRDPIWLSVGIMVNNSTTNKNLIGTVNGLQVSLLSLFRIIGQIPMGLLYGWVVRNIDVYGVPIDQSFCFFIVTIISFFACLLTIFSPKALLKIH
ncbi:hypothetical protein SNEBB_001877 [Seison nebaliae]|nr:hypothetical protein SNEBB_001877 [Seison nebaliae]